MSRRSRLDWAARSRAGGYFGPLRSARRRGIGYTIGFILRLLQLAKLLLIVFEFIRHCAHPPLFASPGPGCRSTVGWQTPEVVSQNRKHSKFFKGRAGSESRRAPVARPSAARSGLKHQSPASLASAPPLSPVPGAAIAAGRPPRRDSQTLAASLSVRALSDASLGTTWAVHGQKQQAAWLEWRLNRAR